MTKSKKHISIILAIVATAGTIATGIFAAKSAPKAKELLEKAEKKKESELTAKEKVIAVAPAYVVPVAVGFGTIVCIWSSTIYSARQQAALASAYGVLSHTFTKYKEKIKELYGEEAHEKVIKSLAIEQAEPIHITATGGWVDGLSLNTELDTETRLFYDVHSQRYFETTLGQVLSAQYHLNRNMMVLRGSFVPLSMWYDFIGISAPEGSEQIGWMINDCYTWIDFDNRRVELEDGLECIFVEFLFEPKTEDYIDEKYC